MTISTPYEVGRRKFLDFLKSERSLKDCLHAANPYLFDDRASEEFRRGWLEADKENRKENAVNTTVKKIKLKPIISEVEIQDGSWKYVVLDESSKAVAMFVSLSDAESFIYDNDCYTIREYDGEN